MHAPAFATATSGESARAAGLPVRRPGFLGFMVGSAIPRQSAAMLARRIAIVLLGSCLAAPSFAFRCGSHIVSEGDTRAQVLARCGEPADVSRSEIERRIWLGGPRGHPGYGSGHDFVVLPVEYWIYNLGPNRLMQRLRFIDGVVVEIESLGYGYNEP